MQGQWYHRQRIERLYALWREVYDNPQLFVPLATWTALLLMLLFIGI